MEISKDTLEVLAFLDYTSSGTLRKRSDLGVILEVLATNNLPELANEIIFYGSALWGSYRIAKNNPDVDTSNLKKEIENLFDKMTQYIYQIVELLPELELCDRFTRVYLQPTIGSRSNIIDLCYDLNELKKVQLKLKK
jgi:hypothetical protein